MYPVSHASYNIIERIITLGRQSDILLNKVCYYVILSLIKFNPISFSNKKEHQKISRKHDVYNLLFLTRCFEMNAAVWGIKRKFIQHILMYTTKIFVFVHTRN